jgi:uncharacterized membrane protein
VQKLVCLLKIACGNQTILKNTIMFKQIKILGHPVHPLLVGFPIALYTATLASYVIYVLTFDIFWFRAGFVANVAGVATAGLAAFTGIMDLILLPNGSRAKTTGFKHMGFNLAAFFLFFVNIFLQMNRWQVESLPGAGSAIVFSALGVVCTFIAGYFGWEMVQKHHVGIDLTPEQKKLEPEQDEDEQRMKVA